MQVLYADVEALEQELERLKEQRRKLVKAIEANQEELQSLLHINNQTNIALQEANADLADLLGQKKDVDESVQQIMLNNLDIIKSLKGNGQHKFDFTDIVNLTNSVVDFDLSQLHQIQLGDGA